MNLIKSLLAVSILTASQAQATCYNTTGSMTGISMVGAILTPSLYVHAGSAGYSTLPSIFPSFAGAICIDTSVNPATVIGIYADFAQYSVSIKNILHPAVVNQSHQVYSFNGGTTTWTQAPSPALVGEGTFTLGQAMTMTGGNSQTSDATLLFDTANGAYPGNCSSSCCTAACSDQNNWFLPYPDLERFYMTVTITYDPALGKFKLSGTSVGSDVGGAMTGNLWYSYNFTGLEQ